MILCLIQTRPWAAQGWHSGHSDPLWPATGDTIHTIMEEHRHHHQWVSGWGARTWGSRDSLGRWRWWRQGGEWRMKAILVVNDHLSCQNIGFGRLFLTIEDNRLWGLGIPTGRPDPQWPYPKRPPTTSFRGPTPPRNILSLWAIYISFDLVRLSFSNVSVGIFYLVFHFSLFASFSFLLFYAIFSDAPTSWNSLSIVPSLWPHVGRWLPSGLTIVDPEEHS